MTGNDMADRADILIVDDTPANLDLLSSMLSEKGYRFRVATSGQRAIAAATSARPDLVMLDITMPDMDGYEVCRRLRRDPATADVPVIFISALDAPLDKVRAFEAGGRDYVPKPFHFEEVHARIEHQLSISRLQRRLEARNEELATTNAILLETSQQLELANRELERLSTTDALTGIANRRQFHTVLDREWRRCRREGAPLSLLMVDVDCFKLYNDTYGHQKGDECLAAVAGAIRGSLQRASDIVARYGGEELVVVLPQLELEPATAVAEQLCAQIRALAIPHAHSTAAPHVTVSIGIASAIPDETSTEGSLISAADAALYEAKRGGRDRAVKAALLEHE
jgi:diguanylate cyclase (GGDEF)-like protein